jgi:hypothetical protein
MPVHTGPTTQDMKACVRALLAESVAQLLGALLTE